MTQNVFCSSNTDFNFFLRLNCLLEVLSNCFLIAFFRSEVLRKGRKLFVLNNAELIRRCFRVFEFNFFFSLLPFENPPWSDRLVA